MGPIDTVIVPGGGCVTVCHDPGDEFLACSQLEQQGEMTHQATEQAVANVLASIALKNG